MWQTRSYSQTHPLKVSSSLRRSLIKLYVQLAAKLGFSCCFLDLLSKLAAFSCFHGYLWTTTCLNPILLTGSEISTLSILRRCYCSFNRRHTLFAERSACAFYVRDYAELFALSAKDSYFPPQGCRLASLPGPCKGKRSRCGLVLPRSLPSWDRLQCPLQSRDPILIRRLLPQRQHSITWLQAHSRPLRRKG